MQGLTAGHTNMLAGYIIRKEDARNKAGRQYLPVYYAPERTSFASA